MRCRDAHDVVEEHIDTGQPEVLGRRVEVELDDGWLLDVYLASERNPMEWLALITRFHSELGEHYVYSMYPTPGERVTLDHYRDIPVDEHDGRDLSEAEAQDLKRQLDAVVDRLDREGRLE